MKGFLKLIGFKVEMSSQTISIHVTTIISTMILIVIKNLGTSFSMSLTGMILPNKFLIQVDWYWKWIIEKGLTFGIPSPIWRRWGVVGWILRYSWWDVRWEMVEWDMMKWYLMLSPYPSIISYNLFTSDGRFSSPSPQLDWGDKGPLMGISSNLYREDSIKSNFPFVGLIYWKRENSKLKSGKKNFNSIWEMQSTQNRGECPRSNLILHQPAIWSSIEHLAYEIFA